MAAFFLLWQGQNDAIEAGRIEVDKQKQAFLEKKKLAVNLEAYKQQRAEIERFQARRLELRKELRQVQRDLDRDIEGLGTRLKVLNVALVPLVISVLSVILVLVRRRARRAGAAA